MMFVGEYEICIVDDDDDVCVVDVGVCEKCGEMMVLELCAMRGRVGGTAAVVGARAEKFWCEFGW